MKFVAIENALDVFCKDYFYDVESNRKKNIRNHRGQGVLLPDRYKHFENFIGPEEKYQYFQ